MSSLLEHVREEIMHLSSEERGLLAHELLISLEPDDANSEQAWENEIARRVERIRSGTEQGFPAEEVLAEHRQIINASSEMFALYDNEEETASESDAKVSTR
jgi:putative addiction module component (TIGR02574 family)